MNAPTSSAPAVPKLTHYRLLFVCMGNICRSPAGEGIMRHLVKKAGLDSQITIDSAGTIGFHKGHPPDERMTENAASRGYVLDSKARQFVVSDFKNFDLILTMDQENLRDVMELAPDSESAAKVFPMVAFCTESPPPDNVPDPYYGGKAGFIRVLDILEDSCTHLLHILQRHLKG